MSFVTRAFGDFSGRRVKVLKLHPNLLLQMFRMDGSRAINITGMPADAQIVGITDASLHCYDEVRVLIESSEFSVVEPDRSIPELMLECSYKEANA